MKQEFLRECPTQEVAPEAPEVKVTEPPSVTVVALAEKLQIGGALGLQTLEVSNSTLLGLFAITVCIMIF